MDQQQNDNAGCLIPMTFILTFGLFVLWEMQNKQSKQLDTIIKIMEMETSK